MDHTILTKTLRDGRTATVTIEASPGVVSVTAWRDGERLGNHCGPHHAAPGLPPGYVAAIGRLALTQEEADQVQVAYEAFRAAQPRDLAGERQHLVEAIRAAEQAWLDRRADAWDEFDGSGNPFGGDAGQEACVTTARESLAAFDAEHPEIAAAVMAERDQNVQRWADQ